MDHKLRMMDIDVSVLAVGENIGPDFPAYLIGSQRKSLVGTLRVDFERGGTDFLIPF